MANLGFSLRAVLGLIPATEKIEAQVNQLKQEYDKLLSFPGSELFMEFNSLQEKVLSPEFVENKKKLQSLGYKDSEPFRKELRFKQLSGDARIKNYLKVKASADLQKYLAADGSAQLKEWEELVAKVDANEFKQEKLSLDEKLKAEQKKDKRWAEIKKSAEIKKYFKIIHSAPYKLYQEMLDGEEVRNFEKLKIFAASPELKQLKMELSQKLAAEKEKANQLKKLKAAKEVKDWYKKSDHSEDKAPASVKEYEELNAYLGSQEHKDNLLAFDYKSTKEFALEQEYQTLLKNSRIKSFYRFVQSPLFSFVSNFENGEMLKEYNSLESYIASAEHAENLKQFAWTSNEGFKMEERLKQLNADPSVKHWKAFGENKNYKLYLQTLESDLLQEYDGLKEYLSSEEFSKVKTYLLDKHKYAKTEEFKDEQRYLELKKNEDIKWYFATKDSPKFNELKRWKLTFEEDFDKGKVAEDKWMNAYFWGKMLLNDRYVMEGDKAFYTDNKNLEFNGTSVKITAKNDAVKGKVWNPKFGFTTRDFNYTTGMLSTAHSFRQLYGKFEAKIKINSAEGFYQAFWLKGEKAVPGIDVMKFNMTKSSRMEMSAYNGNPARPLEAVRSNSKFGGGSFTKDYFIYSMEWTKDKITWKINQQEVFSTGQNIPQEPLYMLFSAGLQKDSSQLPASFEIDWVRVYEHVE